MAEGTRTLPTLPRWALTAAVAAATLLASLAVLAAFTPRWETNDDAAMAMVAGGHGIASLASSDIFFSNVLWGRLVLLTPTLGGVGSYGVATYIAIGTAAIALLCLVSHRAGACIALPLFVLLVPKALLVPQFTVHAGLLAAAGVLSFMLVLRGDRPWLLVPGTIFAWVGFLVRPEEAILVIAAGAPILLGRPHHLRAVVMAAAALAAAIGISAAADRAAYRTPAWREYQNLNQVRAAFTDYDAASRLLARPDVMDRNGMSKNDVELVFTWFAEDSALTEPDKLRAIVAELGTTDRDRAMKLNTTVEALQALAAPSLRWLTVAALALLVLGFSWRLAAAWAAALAAFALTGYLGRPGVLHVYVPVLAMLTMAALLHGVRDGRVLSAPRTRIACFAALGIAAMGQISWLLPSMRQETTSSDKVLEELRRLPAEPIVIWGEYFPFEEVYAPLRRETDIPRVQLYGLGAFSWAPFSVAYTERAAGHGLVARLRSDQGLLLVAHPGNVERLSIYCTERLKGRLRTLSSTPYGFGTLRRVACSSSTSQPTL